MTKSLPETAHVLLVEDRDLDARLVELALRKPVEDLYQIHRVQTLAEAEKQIERICPEVVILDLELPDAEGLQALKQIVTRHKELPVIVLTAHASRGLTTEAIDSGAEDIIFKDDLDQNHFKRAIAFAIERNRVKLRTLEMERRMQEMLRLQSLGTLAGGIAHDFNNALTSVMGNLSVLMEELAGHEEATPPLQEALFSLERAKHLSHQLLALSQRGALEKKPVSARDLLEDTVRFLRSTDHVEIKVDLPDDLWLLHADEYQTVNVIHQVLTNALEAMDFTGEVRITAENLTLKEDADRPAGVAAGDYVRISIRDGGGGIDTSIISRIFEPYFTTKGEGRGIGLANARSIVQNHGGWIEPEVLPTGGTIMHLHIPAIPGAPPDRESRESLPPAETGEERTPNTGKVLLMDDDENIQRTVSMMLKRLGYRPTITSEGSEAIEIYLEHQKRGEPFDLLILDLTVPGGMGGREMITRIRQLDREIKAIVSSGYSDDNVLTNPQTYGFQAKLPKPFTYQQLAASIREQIGDPPGQK